MLHVQGVATLTLRLTSGMASFSLISTGVLCIVSPIAMILLFFSIAYPVKQQMPERLMPQQLFCI